MPAPSRTGLALLAALALAAPAAAAPPPTPKVIPPRATASVIPLHVGMSLAYRFELEQSGPRGTTTTRASVALTRVASDRVTATLTPETGEPTAVAGRVATDGTLHLDAPGDERGTAAADGDLPQDTPLGGLPDDPRGGGANQAGGGRYGGRYGSGTGAASGRAAQTPAWAALAALLAFRATGGTPTPSWTFSAPVGPAANGAVPLVPLTARATTAQNGLVETVVADGRGDVQLAAAESPSAYGGNGTGGTRRRGGGYPGGGQGGYPGGGRGGQGGYPGGGQGGGQGGYPGGGQGGGQGGYPGGGQGGGQAGYPGGGQGGQGGYSGGGIAGRTVPATVVLHVEAVFRDGRLASARGTQTSTLRSGGSDATTTARWTLAAY